MVARFGPKLVFGSRVLMGRKVKSVLVARLFEKIVSGSRVMVGGHHSVLVARFGENLIFGSRPLVGGTSQRFGRWLSGVGCG